MSWFLFLLWQYIQYFLLNNFLLMGICFSLCSYTTFGKKIPQHSCNGVRCYNACKKNNPIRPQRKRLDPKKSVRRVNDGAEICELVGLYILTEIHKNMAFTSVGLYRDDGLAVIRSASGSSLDRYRKKLITLFQDNELKITAKTGKTSINFCLNSESYQPYRKPNDEPLYINRNSNHPPTILSRLPQTISKRISSLSSNFKLFSRAAPIYNAALENAGYMERVKYDSEINVSKPPRNRKQNIIWYNPPYNKSVSYIGRVFLNLLDKHFHKEHKLNKIFNRNSVKVSYSCTRNIEHIIKNHNRKITESYIEKSAETLCNCKEKNKCPLEGNCLIKNIVYMATVETETNSSSYVGMTGNSFKTRYYNHFKSFKNKRNKNETELSKYIWKLKEKEVKHTITWKTLRQSNTCQRRSGLCNLCIEEKVEILLSKAKPSTRLNCRFEVSTCRHVSPPTSTAPTSKLIKT